MEHWEIRIYQSMDMSSITPMQQQSDQDMDIGFDEVLGSGATQSQVANDKISWEKSTQMNVGVDLDFVNSKLSASFDYYIRNINNMLQQFPIPRYVGLSSAWENAGSMRNDNGWDYR